MIPFYPNYLSLFASLFLLNNSYYQFTLSSCREAINLCLALAKNIIRDEDIFQLFPPASGILLNKSQTAIVIYPLIIYRYGDKTQLSNDLEKIGQKLGYSQESINSWLVWTVIIHLIWTREIQITEKITPQITIHLEKYQSEEIKPLELIDMLIEKKSPLSEAEAVLSQTSDESELAIYQSLYNFLCLPNPIETGLKRSANFKKQKEETIALNSILLGLFNSWKAITQKCWLVQKNRDELGEISQKIVDKWRGKMQ